METKEIGWHMDFHSLKTIYEVLMYDHCLEVLNILLAVLTSCFNEMCKTKTLISYYSVSFGWSLHGQYSCCRAIFTVTLSKVM